MKGVTHSYNMYLCPCYPIILRDLKEELNPPDEIMKQIDKEGEVKDEMVKDVKKKFQKRLK